VFYDPGLKSLLKVWPARGPTIAWVAGETLDRKKDEEVGAQHSFEWQVALRVSHFSSRA
jgi:hypothetical protein